MRRLKTFDVPLRLCPYCGAEADRSTGDLDRGPGKDDATLCLYCGEIGMFNADLTVRRATTAEAIAGLADKVAAELLFLQALVKAAPRLPRRPEKPQ